MAIDDKPDTPEKITGLQDKRLSFTPQELDDALEKLEEARRREMFGKYIDTLEINAVLLDIEVLNFPDSMPKPRSI